MSFHRLFSTPADLSCYRGWLPFATKATHQANCVASFAYEATQPGMGDESKSLKIRCLSLTLSPLFPPSFFLWLLLERSSLSLSMVPKVQV